MWRVYQRGLERWLANLLQPVFDNLVVEVAIPRFVQRLRILEFTLDHEAPTFSQMRRRSSRKDSDLNGVVNVRYTGGARMLLLIEVGQGRWRFKVGTGPCTSRRSVDHLPKTFLGLARVVRSGRTGRLQTFRPARITVGLLRLRLRDCLCQALSARADPHTHLVALIWLPPVGKLQRLQPNVTFNAGTLWRAIAVRLFVGYV